MRFPAQLPFILHLVVEGPASVNFLFRPSCQFSVLTPHAHAVVRQYAFMLISSNIIALIIILDQGCNYGTVKRISGALAIYHLAPIARACGRLQQPKSFSNGYEPSVHLIAHLICLIALLAEWLRFP